MPTPRAFYAVSLYPLLGSADTRYLEEIGVFKASDNIAIDH